MEGVVGIGITISPILGVCIESAVGFSATFYIFGGAMSPCAFLMLCLPDPKDLRMKNSAIGLDEKNENKKSEDDEMKEELILASDCK